MAKNPNKAVKKVVGFKKKDTVKDGNSKGVKVK